MVSCVVVDSVLYVSLGLYFQLFSPGFNFVSVGKSISKMTYLLCVEWDIIP